MTQRQADMLVKTANGIDRVRGGSGGEGGGHPDININEEIEAGYHFDGWPVYIKTLSMNLNGQRFEYNGFIFQEDGELPYIVRLIKIEGELFYSAAGKRFPVGYYYDYEYFQAKVENEELCVTYSIMAPGNQWMTSNDRLTVTVHYTKQE